MNKVFVLQHAYENADGYEDVKLIGVYSSEMRARATVEKLRLMPGFRDHPAGFHIDEYSLDEDHWLEGFGA